jgi:photosynthetic reaction center cytochrome c subunit
MRHLILAACVFALTGTMATRAQQTPQNPIPEKFTNLKVLPKDISRGALVNMMKGFTGQTGTRCSYCHLGEESQDLSQYDFASDARPAKAVARKMLLMVRAINGPLLEGVGEPAAAGAQKVTCFTCHRGEKKPATAAPGK